MCQRTIGTTDCSGDSTGCASEQYCVNFNNMITPGFCRNKQAAGNFCVPRRNGVDCTSGTCNNIIPSDTAILGIPISVATLGFSNWIGTCA